MDKNAIPKKPAWWPYSWDWNKRKHLWNNPSALEQFRVTKRIEIPYTPASKPIWWPSEMKDDQELWDNPTACERFRQNLALKQMKREKNHIDYGYNMDELKDLSTADKQNCNIS
jgi:hypothetical protein